MNNKHASIPIGMVFLKFYCHKCGAKLVKHSQKKTLTKDDPEYDYYYHNISRKSDLVIAHKDIDVLEYVFRCPACENIIEYEKQRDIRKIQKKLKKNILSDEELSNV